MPIAMPLLVLTTVIVGLEAALLFRAVALFLAARWLRVEVDHVSLGFGWTLCSREIRGLRVRVRCVPLGVFVAIPSIRLRSAWRAGEGEETRRRGRDRFLLSLAAMVGALLSLAIPAVALWEIGVVVTRQEPGVTVDWVPENCTDAQGTQQPNPEWAAGLRAGDRIASVNGKPVTEGWGKLAEAIVLAPGEVRLTITRDGQSLDLCYTPAKNPVAEGLPYPFFEPRLNVVVNGVAPDSPAEGAGLRVGDVVREVDGVPVGSLIALQDHVQESSGKPMALVVERNGEPITFAGIHAKPRTLEDGETRYLLGIILDETAGTKQLVYPAPWQTMAEMLKPRLPFWLRRNPPTPTVVARHMSGPIGILQMAACRVARSPRSALRKAILLPVALVCALSLAFWPFLDAGRACLGLVQLGCPRRTCLKAAVVLLCLAQLLPMALITIQDMILMHRFG